MSMAGIFSAVISEEMWIVRYKAHSDLRFKRYTTKKIENSLLDLGTASISKATAPANRIAAASRAGLF